MNPWVMWKKMMKILHQTDKLKAVKKEDEAIVTLMGFDVG